MAKIIVVGAGTYHNPKRVIELGALQHTIAKYQSDDVEFVLYKLSYAGKYLYIKGRSLAGSLVMFVNDLNSFDPDSQRAKGHFYNHFYKHILSVPDGRFRVKVLFSVDYEDEFYKLLKYEQAALDEARYDPSCLNNQMDAYVPKYNESTGMHGWIPKSAVMNFSRWLESDERRDALKQYKK